MAANPLAWSLPTLGFSVGTVALVTGAVGNRLPKAMPAGTDVVIVLVLMTAISAYTDHGSGVVGEIPAMGGADGLTLMGVTIPLTDPRTMPWAELATALGGWPMLVVKSALFSVVNFLAIISVCGAFESEAGLAWSPPRELFAQGVACVAGGIGGAAPVGGSLSRSLLARKVGATSSLTAIFNGVMFITMLPFAGVLAPTPKSTLAAIVIAAVYKGVLDPKELMAFKGQAAVCGWATAAACTLIDPSTGFGIGLAISLVAETRRRE